MTDFATLRRCAEITDDVVAEAVASRAAMRALLTRASEIARPMEGAARILVALARMATNACDWLDGDLVVEIVGDDEVAVVEVMSELGGGFRERIFPTFTLHVALDEFVRAVRLVPRMVTPLRMQEKAGRLVFTATEAVRTSTRPPPAAEVEEDLLTIEVTAPESAPKLRARPPTPSLAREEPPETPRTPPVIVPAAAKAPPLVQQHMKGRAPPPPRVPTAPIAPVLVQERGDLASSRRGPAPPLAPASKPSAMPVFKPARPPATPPSAAKDRADFGSSRRLPAAPIAPASEERASAKVASIPRDDDDELGGFFDDLEMGGAPAAAASAPAKAPEPPKAPERRPVSPMLMPKYTPISAAKRPSQRPAPKRPSQKPVAKRVSQKPTIARMSAVTAEELDALRPARLPAIAYDHEKPTAGAMTPLRVEPPESRRVEPPPTKRGESASDEPAPPTRKVSSTRPAQGAPPPPPPPTRRAQSALPTARPATGVSTVPEETEKLDDGWD
jgi:hypothetical protein